MIQLLGSEGIRKVLSGPSFSAYAWRRIFAQCDQNITDQRAVTVEGVGELGLAKKI